MAFKNFMAAGRKPNIKRFGLLPDSLNLDWIDGVAGSAPTLYTHPTTITGTMNGVNATFTLSGVTQTPQVEQVVWNGVVLKDTTAYSISGATLTMAAGYIPDSGDTLDVYAWNY